jgi:hypothetical protein
MHDQPQDGLAKSAQLEGTSVRRVDSQLVLLTLPRVEACVQSHGSCLIY